MLRAWKWYQRCLASHPVKTQIISSGVLWGLGDVAAQKVTHSMIHEENAKDLSIDRRRVATASMFGIAFVGPVGHYWYLYLDRFIRLRLQLQPKSMKFVTTKVAADGLIFGPLDLLTYFTYIGFASGKSTVQVKEDVKRDLLPGLVVGLGIWPIIQEWEVGSLEEKVQRLVKTLEMELVHKIRPEDRKSINVDKFLFSVNGRQVMTSEEIKQVGGSYNAFLQTSLPKELRFFDPDEETGESSDQAFRTTFPRGFALEVVEVLAGPPKITFRFRHWGFMEGDFKGHEPTGEKVEFHGICIFQVDENMKVEKMEVFYERGELLAGLLKGRRKTESSSSCPFLKCIK